ncbi:TIM barrel protein [Brucella sp. 10RB9214]|uniref:2-oxo-tetronate isomerase n=1 Tax=unclassified Brucella TaxID=2632610 RepID=UPI000972E99D|nr:MULTISPECIES: 2-oxo-tetronate isomerase [unclassified Brucella]APY15409.1 hydroxypyruvate isomerase [Brucella sp. 09RB8910]MRN46508.1 TIM barrel protein [Brucella sp. 10RB9212]MRN50559.1 TIM barrel protein [Brucella sp. 10RB9214]
MPRFAANLSTMFNEVPFLERFRLAAEAGFGGVEFLFPYDFDADVIARELKQHNLTQVLFNMPPGGWAAGERGMAAIPGREQEFRDNVDIALHYALALDCRTLHAMSGITEGLDRKACEETFIENFRYAADKLAPHGITVLVEPLNTRNMPGYFIVHQLEAVDLVKRVNRPNVAVQLDLYHAQIMDGDLTRLIEKMNGAFSHVQIASVPDRHEPDEGELNYPYLFSVLESVGYRGWVGCEYNPRGKTESGLAWFAPYRDQSA